jgi:hypothetical protein
LSFSFSFVEPVSKETGTEAWATSGGYVTNR